MLWSITLTYIRPAEDIKAHLDTHRAWLAEHTEAGRIIAAGPMEPPTGGMVLAFCANREELNRMLQADSFHVHSLVDYDVRSFKPAMRSAKFPEHWAADAKAI
ncbi:YciI family protein [Azospirillum doebereinerae]